MLDAIRDFLDPQRKVARQITILKPEAEISNEGLDALIKIGTDNPHSDTEIDQMIRLLDEKQVPSATETAFYFEAKILNLLASGGYTQNLRAKTPDIIPTSPDYDPKQEYSFADLTYLADRWQIPAMFYRVGGRHWNLCLREPEMEGNGWKVLVYDPLVNGEHYITLQNGWNANWQNAMDVLGNGFCVNSLCLEAHRQQSYDLTLPYDELKAKSTELLEAKTQRFQNNIIDCGTLCLFSAALREGLKKEDFNAFQFSGRDQFERDTGVHIKTREELGIH